MSNKRTEHRREWERNYYKKNREKEIAKVVRYRKENRELVSMRAKQHHLGLLANDPQQVRAKESIYSAFRNDRNRLGFEHSKEARAELLAYCLSLLPSDHRCSNQACRVVFTYEGVRSNSSMSLDHIDPTRPIGIGNVWWICSRCNLLKSNHTPASMIHFGHSMLESIRNLGITHTPHHPGLRVSGGTFLETQCVAAEPEIR